MTRFKKIKLRELDQPARMWIKMPINNREECKGSCMT